MNWNEVAEFFVGGAPKAQPRAKGRVMPVKGWARAIGARTPRDLMSLLTVSIYTPDVAKDWKVSVRRAGKSSMPAERLAGPVRVELAFMMPRPKYMDAARYGGGTEYHAVKPDADNLAKAVLDALGDDGGWWGDDSQVVELSITKHYHGRHGAPGCAVRVMALADSQMSLLPDPPPKPKKKPTPAPAPTRALVVPTLDGRWRVKGGPPGTEIKPFRFKLDAHRAADRINDADKPNPLAATR